MAPVDPAWLAPTWFLDTDAAAVGEFVDRARGGASDPVEVAVRLFHAVRDGIRYDPYHTSPDPHAYRASSVAVSSANWCVPKAVLLTAAARRCGIPARLGFADVRNHLTSEKLSATMGTDVFFWHGFSELYVADRWCKVSTAFNIELCHRFGVKVLEWDGTGDALMHPYDEHGHRHMEYVRQRGSFDDLPLEQILATFAEVYPSFTAGSVHPDDDAFAER